ncbi:MAG: ABC transporter ATP-binding protein/permease [SAR202 cluster bacterium]|nr:ABC transporter ATP-binding protein/permease [SAR202 cluster bacterium]
MATRHKWNLILAYACMLGATTSFLITPKFIGKAVDKIAASYNDGIIPTSLIIETVIAIVLLMSIRGFLSFWQTSLGENLSHKIAYSLRNKFFNKVQTISFDFHDKWHTGELISRAISDIENVRMSINMGLMRAPYFIAMFVIVSILLINLHWMLGIISIAFMPIISFNSINVRLKMRQLLRKIQITTAELSTISQENFSGARVVRSFASSKYEQSKFDSKNQEIFYQTIDAEKLRAKNATFMRFAFTVSIGIVLLIGGRLVINNELTWGELTQFIIYMQILSMPVTMAAWLVNAYARAVSSGERLFEILDAKSKLKESTNALKIEKSNGHIIFDNVSFSYDKNISIIKNLNFEIKPGEKIAIIGTPGSGKTTIANLIPRFYDVTDGKILLDNIDIREINLNSLRKNIGLIQQDIFLFATTIRENIAYGKENATIEEVINAAKTAQIHNYIETLDKGYDTIIGERGTDLSGGQKQRIGIARAVILNPSILIMDDTTSSVDTETESLINDSLKTIMENRTTLIISNRISTVQKANKIFVIEKGEIIEEGRHQELLEKNGKYKNIYNLQLKPTENKATTTINK